MKNAFTHFLEALTAIVLLALFLYRFAAETIKAHPSLKEFAEDVRGWAYFLFIGVSYGIYLMTRDAKEA